MLTPHRSGRLPLETLVRELGKPNHTVYAIGRKNGELHNQELFVCFSGNDLRHRLDQPIGLRLLTAEI